MYRQVLEGARALEAVMARFGAQRVDRLEALAAGVYRALLLGGGTVMVRRAPGGFDIWEVDEAC